MDGHVGMFFAAKFLALAVEVAGFFGAEPGVTYKTRDGILLDTKSRHSEGVNHVIGRGDHTNFLTDRDHQGVVHFEQVIVSLWLASIGHGTLGRIECRDVAQAFAFTFDVVVTPFPLVTRGLDGQIRVGGVFLGHQNFGSRQGHQDHDQERHCSPNDFDGDRFGESSGLVADRFAMLPDGIKHDRKNRNEDHRTKDQHEPMEPMLLFGNLGHRRVKIELIDSWSARQIIDRVSRSGKPGTGKNASTAQQRCQFVGNDLHSSH